MPLRNHVTGYFLCRTGKSVREMGDVVSSDALRDRARIKVQRRESIMAQCHNSQSHKMNLDLISIQIWQGTYLIITCSRMPSDGLLVPL